MAKKENILDLNQHLNKEILVKFHGGREVKGQLKGFDALLNLVLDDAIEFLRDPEDPYKEKADGETRNLGLLVCRGSAVMCLYPTSGVEEIQNPFATQE
eukprot:TRINITY_DN4595_c0_g1_i1.p1 TRINITY_DN4595_c0_g1~~TRINITY_DN4595_c0_g1_i1.p1  ORF type:complete len:108 (-),score=18.06 TRINITY_DN4595_c0_g1_i1:89-385(-)